MSPCLRGLLRGPREEYGYGARVRQGWDQGRYGRRDAGTGKENKTALHYISKCTISSTLARKHTETPTQQQQKFALSLNETVTNTSLAHNFQILQSGNPVQRKKYPIVFLSYLLTPFNIAVHQKLGGITCTARAPCAHRVTCWNKLWMG